MAWYRCGGGGSKSPQTIWRGSLDEYNSLVSIDKDTLYLCSYDYLGITAIYIGNTKIYPIDINPNDYDWLAGDGSNAFVTTTDISWLDGSDFDIDFILGQSSYSGTQVLFGNSSSDVNFNLILAGTEMKIYGFDSYSQVSIDTIVPYVPYKVTKRENLYSFYRENTLLTTRTRSGTSSGKLMLFNWSSFPFSGKIQRLGFKFVTE